MAGNKRNTKTYVGIHKLKAVVILLSILVVTLAGLFARVSLTTILVRSTVVFVVVVAVSRIVVQILKTNEEMGRG